MRAALGRGNPQEETKLKMKRKLKRRVVIVTGVAIAMTFGVGVASAAGPLDELLKGEETNPEEWRLVPMFRPQPGMALKERPTLRKAVRSLTASLCAQHHWMLLSGDAPDGQTELVLSRTEGNPRPMKATAKRCKDPSAESSPWIVEATLRYPKGEGGSVIRGPMPVPKASRRLVEVARNRARTIVAQGGKATFTLALVRIEKPVPDMIRALAKRYRVDEGTALRIAWCESHYDPEAYNSAGYGGVFQQDVNYWPKRAQAYGHGGESVFDALANVDVSLQMARDSGWGHWGCY